MKCYPKCYQARLERRTLSPRTTYPVGHAHKRCTQPASVLISDSGTDLPICLPAFPFLLLPRVRRRGVPSFAITLPPPDPSCFPCLRPLMSPSRPQPYLSPTHTHTHGSVLAISIVFSCARLGIGRFRLAEGSSSPSVRGKRIHQAKCCAARSLVSSRAPCLSREPRAATRLSVSQRNHVQPLPPLVHSPDSDGPPPNLLCGYADARPPSPFSLSPFLCSAGTRSHPSACSTSGQTLSVRAHGHLRVGA
ncbi:hypothetical protein C8Q73DRAFT_421090 [Cubamyces lactineus]|nr:hypothetical protein C8Q73DRAFT_421090 [Cubamyces lactineus]